MDIVLCLRPNARKHTPNPRPRKGAYENAAQTVQRETERQRPNGKETKRYGAVDGGIQQTAHIHSQRQTGETGDGSERGGALK